MASKASEYKAMQTAIGAVIEALTGFSPGKRGVIINAAQQIIGVTEPVNLDNEAMYGVTEDDD